MFYDIINFNYIVASYTSQPAGNFKLVPIGETI